MCCRMEEVRSTRQNGQTLYWSLNRSAPISFSAVRSVAQSTDRHLMIPTDAYESASLIVGERLDRQGVDAVTLQAKDMRRPRPGDEQFGHLLDALSAQSAAENGRKRSGGLGIRHGRLPP